MKDTEKKKICLPPDIMKQYRTHGYVSEYGSSEPYSFTLKDFDDTPIQENTTPLFGDYSAENSKWLEGKELQNALIARRRMQTIMWLARNYPSGRDYDGRFRKEYLDEIYERQSVKSGHAVQRIR